MLEKAGYQVQLAADGLEALEILGHTRCDLVITDLEMPRTNGYELMAHLRQDPATRGVPVMVVTSRAGAKHRERALRQGAAEFLVKPVQEEQFIAAVSKLTCRDESCPGSAGGARMSTMGTNGAAKLLLIDNNIFFARRLSEALKLEGFEVIHSPQPTYALTMLEWTPPRAILCATNLQEISAYEIPGYPAPGHESRPHPDHRPRRGRGTCADEGVSRRL